MQRNLLFFSLSFFLLSSSVQANLNYSLDKLDRNKYHLSTQSQYHNSTIESESSASSINKSSDFTILAQTVEFDYFFSEKFSLVASYYFALVLDIDAEVQGFDLGAQYYFLENGASKEVSFMGKYIQTSPALSPFFYLGASTRDYQFSTVSLKFQGITAKLGADYHINDDYFLRGSGSFQYHLNNNIRTMQSFGINLGIGYKF